MSHGTLPKPARRVHPVAWISLAVALLAVTAGGLALSVRHHNKPAGPATVVNAAAPLPQDPCGGGVCNDSPLANAGAAEQTGATFTVAGELELKPGQFTAINGTSCTGAPGFDDLALGAQVTVTDAGGAVVGVGKLDSVTYTADADSTLGLNLCDLKFTVAAIPAGRGYYGVEVSHRGSVKFSEASLKAGPLQLFV